MMIHYYNYNIQTKSLQKFIESAVQEWIQSVGKPMGEHRTIQDA